ncbi:hypothetical protein MtrunA17_Chr8g0358011 [Medicago truncatula]|uniref:Uncharacterized protein n=1 Tax=Medicago truncatula TaxID=3880 RepID=G7L9C2_MEDTR|nr:hypothetical protein MTR_8g052100 [Medicago truncatula]AFK47251.1 unknown [Medicago truncatula]RHN40733.1 hypothetical protein MtrunA17_Chr8g0358011 [Medicago truncatula]
MAALNSSTDCVEVIFGLLSWFEVLQGISISKRWYEIHYGQHLPALGATKRLRN